MIFFFHPMALFAMDSSRAQQGMEMRTRLFNLDHENQRTLEVEIHFARGDEVVAMRVEEIIKELAPPLLKYFSYIPRDTIHVAVDGRKRTANGLAAVWPRNSIVLYNFPPLGREHLHVNDDWLKSLVAHEFIHIIQMEQTHGILQVLRRIFGSVAKQGGLVPRWFSEGVAVWGESTFLPRGRLDNDSLEYELRILFEREDFCQTIDCLDDPGKHPYGQYPYWIGAYFLNYIEKKTKGAISCIVKKNSRSLPFFLQNSFKECLSENVELAFEKFRYSYKKEIEKDREVFRTSFPKKLAIANAIGHERIVDWQKGVIYAKGILFYAVREGQSISLAQRNLKDKREKVHRLPKNMAMIPHPSPYSRQVGLLPIAMYRSPFKEKKQWALWDIENQTLRDLKLKENPDYLFLIGKDRFLTMIFRKGRWHLYLEDGQRNEEIHAFPPLVTINDPRIFIKENRPWLSARSYRPK